MSIKWLRTFKLASFLVLSAAFALKSDNAIAQNIVPDNTLGKESSTVTPNVEINGVESDGIEGGAQRGANLFHSFSEFNVEGGRGAYFANPAGIENILGRVTGANPSEILGTLGVQGNANLFLINPNGIIFGENARLDLGGSFLGTTADGVRFGETGIFSATEPETSSLLTINPSALFFNAMGTGEITNRSQVGVRGETNSGDAPVGLQVPDGNTLALVGGDVLLEGGNLTATGGRIELGSVAGTGEVNLNQSGNNWKLKYDEINTFGNIKLQDEAFVDVSGSGGGDVQIQGNRFEMLGSSSVFTVTDGSEDGGEIFVRANETVSVSDGSELNAWNFGSGVGGNVKIETGRLILQDGARINADASNESGVEAIEIDASESVQLITSDLSTDSNRDKDSGSLKIQTRQLILQEGAEIYTGGSGGGDAGDININASESVQLINSNLSAFNDEGGVGGIVTIETGQLNLQDGAEISAGTVGEGIAGGDAGSLRINAFESVELIASYLSTLTEGGEAGDIIIDTRNLIMQDGAEISADSGESDAADVKINASESVQLIASYLSTEALSVDSLRIAEDSVIGTSEITEAGDITIDTGKLIIRDGAEISTATYGLGDGGNLRIDATESVSVVGTSPDTQFIFPSRLSTETNSTGTGKAGNLAIKTRQLTVRDGAEISTATYGLGDGGNLRIDATESVSVVGTSADNQFSSSLSTKVQPEAVADGGNLEIDTERLLVSDRAKLAANTLGQGNAGDLTVTASQLTLQNQAELSVSGQRDFDPGNLTITADNIALDNQGIIEANTESGSRGNITLNTENLLTLRRESKISTNATGTATGGNITINASDGFIVATPEENSNITANATQDKGGRVFIDATGIYGIKPSQQLTPQSDITASSSLGSEFSGTVEINTPDVDRDRDLVQLPTQPVETRVVPACTPSEGREQSEFVIKGRGGLPPSPESVLDSNSVEADWIARPPQSNQKIANPISDEPAPIIEAQGWVVDDNNEIVLVADNPQNQSWQNLPQCQKKSELKSQKYHNAKGQNYSLLTNNSNNILIASTEPKSLTARVPERITVDRFEVEGNQAFDSEELAKVLAPYKDKPLSFSELLQARSAITQYYTERGYITSGAYIPRQRLQDKVVKIQVVEGYLEDIKITGNKRLNSDYLSDRIETASDSLQQEELLSALQLLQQDPLITSISAELEAGTRPGANVLEVEVIEADSFQTPIMLDNRRTPSVGSFRRQLALDEGNLLGFGDNLFLAYSNTEGSDAFDGSYALPFNARNGTLTLNGGLSSSEVVEEPFNQLNILGDSHYYELSLRQPVIQTPTQEFALGITASRRNSDISSLLEEFDVPLSELSPGADEQGQTRVSALRFFQEWTSRNSREVIAARSQFNLGLDVFDATVNKAAPDSRFFAWQGQAQWARQLAPDTLFLLRGGIQLATTSLLSSEQFGLGGLETLRGYRQDLLLTDNAAFASAEIRLPIFRIDRINSVFQLAPFFDVGTAWNNREERDRSPTNTLASIGLGLRLLFNSFTARLDWGIPLISVNSEKKTWQENGLYFSVEYNPF